MGVVAVIGNGPRVRGWSLGGALVREAGTPAEARQAWTELSARGDVTVVLVDRATEASLAEELGTGEVPFVAVLPT